MYDHKSKIVTFTFVNYYQLITLLSFTIPKRQDFEETHDLMEYFAVMNFFTKPRN